ncbi:MAG: hypothetical protein K2N23_02215 [Clostridia bacterium]|nr:hypothetical protein [Clostridia bacterium]
MERNNALKKALELMAANELFEASKFYCEQFNAIMSEAAFYKALERMVKTNYLIKISKGLYARPEQTKYGLVPPTEEEIVASYIDNCKGIVIGYQLYNALNISTQISKNTKIYCNAIDQMTKNIGNIFIERKEIEFSDEVRNVIEILEVLNNFNTIQELNYNCFVSLCEKFYKQYNEKITKTVLSKIHYPKSTIAFLRNILNHYGIDNTLGENLSVFSTYNYPSMEKIYELAQL